MERVIEPELLDRLPPTDGTAKRSRRDLRRLNAWMKNAQWAADVLAPVLGPMPRPRVVELGAGDGHFFLSVAERLPIPAESSSLLLLDLHDFTLTETRALLAGRNWVVQAVSADVFDWLRQPAEGRFDAVVANLFLHHFTESQLRELLRLAADRADVFVALEPRRSPLALTCSRLVGLVGCGRVTRHDAPVSVRAGFDGAELSALWPASDDWSLEEHEAGLFSHLFAARRRKAKP